MDAGETEMRLIFSGQGGKKGGGVGGGLLLNRGFEEGRQLRIQYEIKVLRLNVQYGRMLEGAEARMCRVVGRKQGREGGSCSCRQRRSW